MMDTLCPANISATSVIESSLTFEQACKAFHGPSCLYEDVAWNEEYRKIDANRSIRQDYVVFASSMVDLSQRSITITRNPEEENKGEDSAFA